MSAYTYERLILNGLRRGIASDLLTLERMTLREYNTMLKAISLREADNIEFEILKAMINRQVNAKKKRGNKEVYIVKDITDIFDKEKIERKIFEEHNNQDTFNRLRKVAMRVREAEEDEL